MKCPKCGAKAPDDAWNCPRCRINLYWVTQHYEGLSDLRERQGVPVTASSPAFLLKAHKDVMDERAQHGGLVENKVRAVARKVMRRSVAPPDSAP